MPSLVIQIVQGVLGRLSFCVGEDSDAFHIGAAHSDEERGGSIPPLPIDGDIVDVPASAGLS